MCSHIYSNYLDAKNESELCPGKDNWLYAIVNLRELITAAKNEWKGFFSCSGKSSCGVILVSSTFTR